MAEHKYTQQQSRSHANISSGVRQQTGLHLQDNCSQHSIIQRHTAPNSPTSSAYKPIQRSMWYDPVTKEYSRYKKNAEQKYELVESGYTDHEENKLTALHEIANEIEKQANAAKDKVSIGPHIAVSIVRKKFYIGINERFNGNVRANDEGVLRTLSKKGINKWLNDNKPKVNSHQLPLNVWEWVDKANNNEIGIVQTKSSDSGKDAAKKGAWHGEIKVAEKIISDLQAKEGKTDVPKAGLQKVIHIGGTKTNCLSCYVLLHGKMTLVHQAGGKDEHSHDITDPGGKFDALPGGKDYNASLQSKLPTDHARKYKFLTGGTHGGVFHGANHLDNEGNPFLDHVSGMSQPAKAGDVTAKVSGSTAYQPEVSAGYKVKLPKTIYQQKKAQIAHLEAQIDAIEKKRAALIKEIDPKQAKQLPKKGRRRHVESQLRGLRQQLHMLQAELREAEHKMKHLYQEV